MTQYALPDPIDPASTSGSDLADILSGSAKWRDALESMHKGSSRPTYAQTGMLWVDDSDLELWKLKCYDGSNDIEILQFSAVSGNVLTVSQIDLGKYILAKIETSLTPPSVGSFNIWRTNVCIYNEANPAISGVIIYGDNGNSAYTLDGDTWTSFTSGLVGGSGVTNYGAAYSPPSERIVVVGALSIASKNVRYSDNFGLTYTEVAAGDATLRDVCWSKTLELYVAVGSVGTGGVNSFYSADGASWTAIAAGQTGDGVLYKVTCLDKLGRFVAVGILSSGLKNIFYSDNGITWTSVGLLELGTIQGLTKSEYLGRYFISRATSSTPRLAYSDDGENWETVEDDLIPSGFPLAYMHYSDIAKHLILANGVNSQLLISSTGKNWEIIASPFSATQYPRTMCDLRRTKAVVFAGGTTSSYNVVGYTSR